MNDTYKTICCLINIYFSGDTFNASEGINWNTVLLEMDKQKIVTLAENWIADFSNDAKLELCGKKYIIRQRIQYEQLLNEQSNICNTLRNQPIVVIKGTAAAKYYPNPMLRTMGDIDILANKETFRKARELLLDNYEIDNCNEVKHTCFRKENVEIELHRRIGVKLELGKADYFDTIIFNALPHAEKYEIEGHEFPILPKTENGLVLLYHIFHHLQDGVGLRHVVDWMAYVDDEEPVDWEKFNSVTQNVGLYQFQCIITKMCEMYLGLRHKSDIDWCKDEDEAICERLMEYIISRGNFGRSMDTYAGKFAMQDIKGNVFKRLQIGGLCRWKAAEKHKVLRPFAWLYQGIRVSKEMLTRENPVAALQADMKEAEKVKALMHDLGLERNSAMPK